MRTVSRPPGSSKEGKKTGSPTDACRKINTTLEMSDDKETLWITHVRAARKLVKIQWFRGVFKKFISLLNFSVSHYHCCHHTKNICLKVFLCSRLPYRSRHFSEYILFHCFPSLWQMTILISLKSIWVSQMK